MLRPASFVRILLVASLAAGIVNPSVAIAVPPPASSTRLEAIDFASTEPMKGYIAGGFAPENGVMSRTTDGGATWRPTLGSRWLHAVSASSDGSSVMASNNQAADWIESSADSGLTWSTEHPRGGSPETAYGGLAHFAESNRRVAVGTHNYFGLIESSVSLGSWTEDFKGPVYPPPDAYTPAPTTHAYLTAIDEAPSRNVAWAVGNDWTTGSNKVHVRKTINDGASWSDQLSYTTASASVTCVTAASDTIAYIGRRTNYLLRTLDGGTNWKVAPTAIVNVPYINAIDSFDANKVVVVGDSGRVSYSTNAALPGPTPAPTWTARNPAGLANHLRGVQMIDADSWIVVGDNETILRTDDAGLNWTGSYKLGNPTTAVASPSSGFVLSSTTINVSGTSADPAVNSSGQVVPGSSGIGVAGVQIAVQRLLDEKYWDGDTWEVGPTWVGATPSNPANGWDAWTASETIDSTGNVGSGVIVWARSRDGMGQYSTSASVKSQVPPVLAAIGNKTVAEGAPLTFQVSATDGNSDALTYSATGLPTGANFNPSTRTFTWTPGYTQAGTYPGVTFSVTDGKDSDSETISITVTNTNRAPTASAQAATTNEDVAKAVTLSGTDPDGDALTYTVTSGPSHGTLSGTAPSLTYTPAANYHGADSFAFRATDTGGLFGTATVSLTVNSVEDVPVAVGQALSVSRDATLGVTLQGTDGDGDPLTYDIVTPPAHGLLTGTGANRVYTPTAGYTGSDGFTFEVSDGKGTSAPGVVTIDVTTSNIAPVLAPIGNKTVAENVQLSFVVSATDGNGDALEYTATGLPSGASFDTSTREFSWKPNYSQAGSHTGVTFSVTDLEDTDTEIITITVTNTNQDPVADNPSVTVQEDALSQPVTLSAADGDGDALTYTVTSGPAHGTLSGTAPDLAYTPDANYHGDDSFTFEAEDPSGGVGSGTVSITVNSVPDLPSATDQAVTTNEDTPKPVTLSGTDPDGEVLTYTVTSGPAHGTLSGTAPALIYTPAANYHGTDSFTFKVQDPLALSDSGTVSITVDSVNDAPVVTSRSVSTLRGTSKAVTLSGTDADGDPIWFEVFTAPEHGELTGIAPDLTYTPVPGYSGPDGFTFIASDGMDDSAPAAVAISVQAPTTTRLSTTSIISGYAAKVTVRGTLKSGSTPLPVGTSVTLKRGSTSVMTVKTGTGGAFAFYFMPSNTAIIYTVAYAGGASFAASSASVKVTPKAKLTRPKVPKTVKRYRYFKTYSYLYPKHASGATGARFYFYKYQKKSNGKYGYVLRKTISAKAANSSRYPTKSRATVKVKLPSGKWRVRAMHADGGHYTTYSSYKYFRVYR